MIDTKDEFLLDKVATATARADVALDILMETIVLLVEKGILTKEETNRYKEKLSQLT